MSSLCVLVSGKGTILEAIIRSGTPIKLVIADRPCRALEIAERFGIPVELVERTDFSKNFDRGRFTDRILKILTRYKIDLVAMAGFMTLFGAKMFSEYPRGYGGHILNSHPAPLTFKGNRAVPLVLAAWKRNEIIESASVIHEPKHEMDTGRILYHIRVAIYPNTTEKSLHERTKKVERIIYPRAIRRKYAELGIEI